MPENICRNLSHVPQNIQQFRVFLCVFSCGGDPVPPPLRQGGLVLSGVVWSRWESLNLWSRANGWAHRALIKQLGLCSSEGHIVGCYRCTV